MNEVERHEEAGGGRGGGPQIPWVVLYLAVNLPGWSHPRPLH